VARRRYSDEDRANALAALAANDGNITRTAEQLGIPRKTLESWSTGDRHPETGESVPAKKIELSDEFERIVCLLLGGITPAKISAASAQQLMTSAAIGVDKMRLLREQATSIAGKEVSDDDRERELRELAERIRQRRVGPAHPNGTGSLPNSDHAD
jgi:transposase-like protein